MTIYQRAEKKGCYYTATCTGITKSKWDELMKGARKADRLKVIKVALKAGVIDAEQARAERKMPYFNPYSHYITKTHIIYVHSAIEHFIKVNL